jgi:uncharacterized damage-inducible protein DinB
MARLPAPARGHPAKQCRAERRRAVHHDRRPGQHIFSAEKRYVDRLSNRPLTDPASMPNDDVEALFGFGRQSRHDLMEFLDSFPATEWDIAREHTILSHKLRLTPRKTVVHVVLHEIRHWAQIATLLGVNGTKTEFQDFLGSPVFGDPHV